MCDFGVPEQALAPKIVLLGPLTHVVSGMNSQLSTKKLGKNLKER
jgi:hypothetical protein